MKASNKFRALQGQVHQVLSNAPQPGPAIFVARCLYILPIFELYSEGLSHLIISALRRFLKRGTTQDDLLEAKSLAAELFIHIVQRRLAHDEKILTKILEVFDINLIHIEEVRKRMEVKSDTSILPAKEFVEQYIFELIESQSYMTAVGFLEHFSIRESGESFLLQMLENKQCRAAEKWAAFMGKPMLCLLVQECIKRNQQKSVCDIIKRNNLREEFPEVYQQCKERQVKATYYPPEGITVLAFCFQLTLCLHILHFNPFAAH